MGEPQMMKNAGPVLNVTEGGRDSGAVLFACFGGQYPVEVNAIFYYLHMI